MNKYSIILFIGLNFLFLPSCRTLIGITSTIDSGKPSKRLMIVDKYGQPLAHVRCGFDAPLAPKSDRRGQIHVTNRDAISGKLLFILDGYKISSFDYDSVPEQVVMLKN